MLNAHLLIQLFQDLAMLTFAIWLMCPSKCHWIPDFNPQPRLPSDIQIYIFYYLRNILLKYQINTSTIKYHSLNCWSSPQAFSSICFFISVGSKPILSVYNPEFSGPVPVTPLTCRRYHHILRLCLWCISRIRPHLCTFTDTVFIWVMMKTSLWNDRASWWKSLF